MDDVVKFQKWELRVKTDQDGLFLGVDAQRVIVLKDDPDSDWVLIDTKEGRAKVPRINLFDDLTALWKTVGMALAAPNDSASSFLERTGRLHAILHGRATSTGPDAIQRGNLAYSVKSRDSRA